MVPEEKRREVTGRVGNVRKLKNSVLLMWSFNQRLDMFRDVPIRDKSS